MNLRIGKTRVHITFLFAAAAAFMPAVGEGRFFLQILLAVMLHEGIHIVLLCLFHCPPRSLVVGIFGVRLPAETMQGLSYAREAVCLLAAPAGNLLCGGLLLWGGCMESAAIHLSLGLCNLLPLQALDGGRGLACLLLRYKTPEQTRRMLGLIELCVFPAVLVLLFCLLLREPGNFSLAVFAVYLVFLLFLRK